MGLGCGSGAGEGGEIGSTGDGDGPGGSGSGVVMERRYKDHVAPHTTLRTVRVPATRPFRQVTYGRTARCRATMPPVRSRHSTSAHPAAWMRAASAGWSGQARIDSAR
ncbi:hypothetical protein SAMN05660690_0611 [Geodermatophilus telluris]|uniref:Uncharacterized protein n=1 Tax=Geodermatophilus telluris TaxID=1190417 RepID=A0A1G6J0P0_9ACTN|nr:hypothetical protein SAMN05660690_0611 [Geodermatophilus telluris]